MKDAKTPLYAVMLANLSNLLMDVLFVYGLNMGAAGAALATSVSQMLSCSILFSAMRERCGHASDTCMHAASTHRLGLELLYPNTSATLFLPFRL